MKAAPSSTPGWDIAYSYSGSNSLKITNANGSPGSDTTTQWGLSGPSYQQGGLSPGQTLTATTTGIIKVKFTWNAHGTGLPAPPNVKVEMIGGASWSCSSDDAAITVTGSCSDTIPGNVKYPQATGRGEQSQARPPPPPWPPPYASRFVDRSGSSFTVTNTVNATVTITVPASNTTGCGYGVAGTFSPRIHAQPYDYVRTNPNPVQNNGTLYFEYDWKSTTGKKSISSLAMPTNG